MAKSFGALQKQIAVLQKQADALKTKEVAGVVARIKEAIEHYGITPQEIFGRNAAEVAGAPRKPGRPAGSGKKRAAKRAELAAVKFRDESGNVWSGRGPRPGWFKAALASGKSPDEFLVKE